MVGVENGGSFIFKNPLSRSRGISLLPLILPSHVRKLPPILLSVAPQAALRQGAKWSVKDFHFLVLERRIQYPLSLNITSI